MGADRLTLIEILSNISTVVMTPILLYKRLRFAQAINQRKGKHSEGLAIPRKITVNITSLPPAYLAMMWDEYNIHCCTGHSLYVIEGGIKYFYYDFWVSSNQLWVADRHARAFGWNVVTPSIIDPKRGDSAVDALKGPWKAWGANRPSVGGTMAITRTFGDLFGLRQPYQKAIRKQPGLRRPAPSKQRSLWQRFCKAIEI